MQRILVVYYSRTGYTKRIAEEIAARCGADIEAIEDVRGRSGILGYLRSAREALKRRSGEIRPAQNDASHYDLVIVGTPVWAGHVSSPVRAYLGTRKRPLTKVAVFCTQGGSGAEKVFKEMAGLCGTEPVASVALGDAEIKHGRYAAGLERFIGALES